MSDLIARLEKATGPDRELDHAITQSLWPGEPLQWPDRYKAEPEYWAKRRVERYTSSIDAALTLVPEGCLWAKYGDGRVEIFHNDASYRDTFCEPMANSVDAASPAIALCIAALKARATAGEEA